MTFMLLNLHLAIICDYRGFLKQQMDFFSELSLFFHFASYLDSHPEALTRMGANRFITNHMENRFSRSLQIGLDRREFIY